MTKPADAAERERAIHERERNVIVDAGAGTGKTTLLIARLMHLIAPEDDGHALQLERIAGITFTRKAAGELKLRLRESLLAFATREQGTALQRERAEAALEALDNATICTVHSFADRMLRLRPADAQLSPDYEIAEDPSALIEETFTGLLYAAQQGRLSNEATETLEMFQAAGLRMRTQELEHYAYLGLEALVRDVIATRDRPVVLPALRQPDFASVRRCCQELQDLLGSLDLRSDGGRQLRRLGEHCGRIAEHETEVSEALRCTVALARELKNARKYLKKESDFADDSEGWEAWRWISQGVRGIRKNKRERDGGSLGDAALAPLMTYMAERLVRLRPVILEHYARVKRAHGVVDQIDLLIELRDLLRRDLDARAFYQARFDHVLVDEFQDTDPLQAEIVSYLCGDGAAALAPGKLTIVGDPKQSIYRFRGADIAMYASVCAELRKAPVCEARLTVNFRSAPSILSWLNAGFDAVLGKASDGPLFDPARGTVKNVPLMAANKARGEPGVHVLPFGDASLSVDEARDLEGEALAHYVRHLVEASDITITDPHTHETRRPRYGDIAVVLIATQTVHHLTTELDRLGVPHVVRGGTLFMQDPVHRQFLLGLCALADPSDGIARAALLRPPFFAVSLEDLARARTGQDSAPLMAAEALVMELRAARHRSTPGELARRVLERSGFGSYVAASVNGAQRLARLYELCRALDELARGSHLDFDGTLALARGYIEAPPRIDAPLPVDADAVQIITAHQAKGLEWPIVALWDGRASWRAYLPQLALTVDAVSGNWALSLDGLSHDPSGSKLAERERTLREAERKRVAYVATTRARELLIIPEAGEPSDKTIAGELLTHTAEAPQHRIDRYERDGDGWWHNTKSVSMRPLTAARPGLEEAWTNAAHAALQPYLVPSGVTSVAHARDIEGEAEDPRVLLGVVPRVGRHGPIFGSAVHRALQLLLTRPISAEVAMQRAALEHALPDHFDVALADVRRAHTALRDAGLLEYRLRLEYPIAGALEPETLLTGYLDLFAASASELVIVDFKTDSPPTAEVENAYPGYVSQVQTYQQLIEATALADQRRVRAALLFTANGALHWV